MATKDNKSSVVCRGGHSGSHWANEAPGQEPEWPLAFKWQPEPRAGPGLGRAAAAGLVPVKVELPALQATVQVPWDRLAEAAAVKLHSESVAAPGCKLTAA